MDAAMPKAAAGTVRMLVLAFVVLVAIALGPWALLGFYLDHFGIPADGEVTEKHEVIGMQIDNWHRDFMVAYRYRAQDGGATIEAAQPVEPGLFRKLQVGDRVRVRYSPWAPLRSLGSAGVTLEGTAWTARLPRWSNDTQFLVEMALCALTVWLVYLAFTRRNWTLGLLAAVAVASVGAGVLLFGFLVFPLLLIAWWRNPGRGLGWALLVSLVLSTAILVWRIPWPAPEPANPQATTLGTVRQLHEVRHVWGTTRRIGQPLRKPYQLVDIEFTPKGARDPVHALDAVDLGSVPGLALGATLPVVYALSEPHQARLSAGTRNFARDLLGYVLLLTYGTGAALLVVGYPIVALLGKASRRVEGLAERAAGIKPPPTRPEQ